MVARQVQRPRRRQRGFTLVELLLAVFLLFLLIGALAFNFSTLDQGAALNDAVDRFETLLRYARAHAANTGHRVRVEFEWDEADFMSDHRYQARLTWEKDPFDRPGVFESLHHAAWDLESLNERVAVEGVWPLNSWVSRSEMNRNASAIDDVLDIPSVTFAPDGSCDPVLIQLASREAEETRKVHIHIRRLTGSIGRHVFQPEPTGE